MIQDNQTEKMQTVNSKIQLIVFKLGEEEYGLQIDQIREVVLTPNVTKMPQTPSYMKGVANIRGNIIAIIDLQDKLEIGLKSEELGKYTLVIQSEDFKAGILVQDVPNTLSVMTSEIDNQFVMGSTNDDYFQGIVKVGKRLIILIDILKVLDVSEFKTIAKAKNNG